MNGNNEFRIPLCRINILAYPGSLNYISFGGFKRKIASSGGIYISSTFIIIIMVEIGMLCVNFPYMCKKTALPIKLEFHKKKKYILFYFIIHWLHCRKVAQYLQHCALIVKQKISRLHLKNISRSLLRKLKTDKYVVF